MHTQVHHSEGFTSVPNLAAALLHLRHEGVLELDRDTGVSKGAKDAWQAPKEQASQLRNGRKKQIGYFGYQILVTLASIAAVRDFYRKNLNIDKDRIGLQSLTIHNFRHERNSNIFK
jgi:hypothetical protein